ncbi:MAG: alpha/beta fold hydrolase, partial [Thermaurantiacus sp.]
MLAQTKIAERPVIVLVHGAFMDASAWRDPQVALEDKGLRVITVNLPGRSANPAEPSEMSLPIYRDAVLAAIAAESRPVILVGHSFGGFSISTVAETAPDKIAALVFVAAYLPRNGQSLQTLA